MLTLILGGRNNGKYEYVKSLGYAEDDISQDFSSKVVYKLNDIIYKQTQTGEFDLGKCVNQLAGLQDIVIVCDEVGSGIVPMDKTEREYRENTGRCCCEIAKIADRVIRVYSGIPSVLKEKV